MTKAGAAWRRFASVPDTWDGWAVRVLTMAVILTMATVWGLMIRVGALSDQLNQVSSSISDGRADRQEYQQTELARQCTTLAKLGVNLPAMKELGCSGR